MIYGTHLKYSVSVSFHHHPKTLDEYVCSLPVFRADSRAPPNPSRGPPPRAQPPPVARGNPNNIVRDGVSFLELGYTIDHIRVSVLQQPLVSKNSTFRELSVTG